MALKPTPGGPGDETAAERAGNQELAPGQVASDTGEQPWPGRDLGAVHDARRGDREDVPGAMQGGERPADIPSREAGVKVSGGHSGARHGRSRPGQRK